MGSCDGAVTRGEGLVLSAVVLAMIAIAGESAFGIMFCVFIVWKFVTGSRAAYWAVSLVALGFGLLQLYDIAKGLYDSPYLSDRIFAWARSMSGIAVAALLWLNKDVRIYFETARKAGKDVNDVASQ